MRESLLSAFANRFELILKGTGEVKVMAEHNSVSKVIFIEDACLRSNKETISMLVLLSSLFKASSTVNFAKQQIQVSTEDKAICISKEQISQLFPIKSK